MCKNKKILFKNLKSIIKIFFINSLIMFISFLIYHNMNMLVFVVLGVSSLNFFVLTDIHYSPSTVGVSYQH